MIPRAHITAWRGHAPWATDALVEQDLVLSRAIVSIFVDPGLRISVAFRGGTALHKLFLPSPARYSEDIDLVQLDAGSIGSVFSALRAILDPWLGEPKRQLGPDGATLIYRGTSTVPPVQPLRIKIEINTREHASVLGVERRPFSVDSPWFAGQAEVATYRVEELLATKLRALYQRKKGRDLFDLWLALTALRVDDERLVDCFERYITASDGRVSRAQFEANLHTKLASPAFLGDVVPLIAPGVGYDPQAAGELVFERLIARLPGAPWKGLIK